MWLWEVLRDEIDDVGWKLVGACAALRCLHQAASGTRVLVGSLLGVVVRAGLHMRVGYAGSTYVYACT